MEGIENSSTRSVTENRKEMAEVETRRCLWLRVYCYVYYSMYVYTICLHNYLETTGRNWAYGPCQNASITMILLIPTGYSVDIINIISNVSAPSTWLQWKREARKEERKDGRKEKEKIKIINRQLTLTIAILWSTDRLACNLKYMYHTYYVTVTPFASSYCL